MNYQRLGDSLVEKLGQFFDDVFGNNRFATSRMSGEEEQA